MNGALNIYWSVIRLLELLLAFALFIARGVLIFLEKLYSWVGRLLLYLVFLWVLFLLALASCSRETWRAPMVLPDSTTAVLPLPAGGKYKFNGPVTISYQQGQGNVATSTATDNYKAGQKGGAAATAPGAVATASTKKAGVPWWVFLLVAIFSALGWEWLRRYVPFLSSRR